MGECTRDAVDLPQHLMALAFGGTLGWVIAVGALPGGVVALVPPLAAIPAGIHKITLENPGADWVTIRKITVGPVGASVSALAKADPGGTRAALWLRRTATGAHPGGGTATLSGLRAGAYKLIWWDTVAGKALRGQALSATSSGQLVVPLPAFTSDIAAYLIRK